MSWFPIGPDFVFSPRQVDFTRLTRYNELGQQGMVSAIAIDPTEPTTMYIVVTPGGGGTSAFRLRATQPTWVCIMDTLQSGDPTIRPTALAINPAHPETLYLAVTLGEAPTESSAVFVSHDRGDTWDGPHTVTIASMGMMGMMGMGMGMMGSGTMGAGRSGAMIAMGTGLGEAVGAGAAMAGAPAGAGPARAERLGRGRHTFDPPLGSGGGSGAPQPQIRALLVDPNSAASLATTVLYAATESGVYRSSNGGVAWANVQPGDIWTLAAHIPPSGTPRFYAGAVKGGVYYTTDPTGTWTNLNTLGIGLPTYSAATATTPENFTVLLVDICKHNPSRAYVWATQPSTPDLFSPQITAALYTCSDPLTAWTSVAMTAPPQPKYGFYDLSFAVAPNSPGDGAHDILFFGALDLNRSADSGQHWATVADAVHADYHAFAFVPPDPPLATIPATYIGCDGGLAVSASFADPAYAIDIGLPSYSDQATYSPLGIPRNLNHGIQNSAMYNYTSDPAFSALGYINCQDNGTCAGGGALGWRGITIGDGKDMAVHQDAAGVTVWMGMGAYLDWPQYRVLLLHDRGDFTPAWDTVLFGPSNSFLEANSNLVVGLDGTCLAGFNWRESLTTLAAPVSAMDTSATPASMAGISDGATLVVDVGPDEETVTVSGTTATNFSAQFAKAHAAGASIQLERSCVGRIAADASVTRISQAFDGDYFVTMVAAHPSNADLLYCMTSDGQVWTTASGSTASEATVWTQLTAGDAPASTTSAIQALAVDSAGTLLALIGVATPASGGDGTSPLYTFSGGAWTHAPSTGHPINSDYFSRLVLDAAQPDTLYISNGKNVYRVTRSGGTWTWSALTDNLPGQRVNDLWVGNIGSAAQPRVLLRAAVPTRGMWERDVTAGAGAAGQGLYLRDNLLDQGWLDASPAGVPNPYDAANAAATLYWWQCADIKVDARQSGMGMGPDYFQTDPEDPATPLAPLDHVLFDQLRDNSQHLPSADQAMVHVQVHNRSLAAADNVSVWALYCNAASVVPSLGSDPSMGDMFPFWSQFHADGTIVPALPSDSLWTPVGPPQVLSGLAAATPQVASWSWTVPTLASGDPGHYCIVAFVHSQVSPLSAPSLVVDEVTPVNRQVGQKNLHIGPALAPGGMGGGGMGGGGMGGGSPMGVPAMEEYVEFHNPTAAARETALVLDLRGLPPQLTTTFRLTRLTTAAPLGQSLAGVARVRRPGIGARIGAALRGVFGWLIALVRFLVRLLLLLGCWLANTVRWVLRRPRVSCHTGPARRLPDFAPEVYEAAPAALVEVRGVRIPPFGFVAARLSIRATGALEPGGEYTFSLRQETTSQEAEREKAARRVLGGSTYIVRIAGKKQHPPRLVTPLLSPARRAGQRERGCEDAVRAGGER